MKASHATAQDNIERLREGKRRMRKACMRLAQGGSMKGNRKKIVCLSVWLVFSVIGTGRADGKKISADFSATEIKTDNLTIEVGNNFMWNEYYKTWRIEHAGGGFKGTFAAPTAGPYKLTVTHLSSASDGCPGGGYSPITIRVNDKAVVSDYDPAANHKATHGWVTDTWMINASTGTNSIRFISGKQCTHYWVKKIELELNNSLANSSTAETQIDHLMLRCQNSYLSPGAEGPEGVEGRMLKLKYWNIPPVVLPGQEVQGRIAWETVSGNPNAVVFAAIIGDWNPTKILTEVYQGMLGQPGKQFEMAFKFTAPKMPGMYRIRWIFPMSFKPILNFYSKEDHGAEDPGNAWWSEMTFMVPAYPPVEPAHAP